ncbi:MAG: hypothetical protein JSU72_18030 [Deltaproteobacteria bacterium]|nr:MAG: hypothetical protein JSU72_18030 [Deltaproteobacteria bacterium]
MATTDVKTFSSYASIIDDARQAGHDILPVGATILSKTAILSAYADDDLPQFDKDAKNFLLTYRAGQQKRKADEEKGLAAETIATMVNGAKLGGYVELTANPADGSCIVEVKNQRPIVVPKSTAKNLADLLALFGKATAIKVKDEEKAAKAAAPVKLAKAGK